MFDTTNNTTNNNVSMSVGHLVFNNADDCHVLSGCVAVGRSSGSWLYF